MSVLLFDIDGTLLRGAARGHRDALIAGIEEITGNRVSFDGIDTSGRLDCDIVRELLRIPARRRSACNEILDTIREAACRYYVENERESLADCVCPGVHRVLADAFRFGLSIGIVSGNFSAIAWHKLTLAGIAGHFTFGAFAEDGRTRSALAGRAARIGRQQLGLPPWIPAILVGDHRNDIIAAKQNRFRSVAVATGKMTVEELRAEQPDVVVSDLTALDLRDLFSR